MRIGRFAAVGTIGAVLLASVSWWGASASASAAAQVGPVRAPASGEVAYAALTWTSATPLTGSERVSLSLSMSPAVSAELSTVGASRVGGTGAPDAEATLTQGYAGPALSPGVGSQGSLGIRVNTPGAYAGTLEVLSSSGVLVERVTYSFTTVGAPVSLTLSSSDTSEDLGGAISARVQVLDASGRLTQPLAVDAVVLSTSLGSVSPATISGTGQPSSSLSDGVADVSVTSATTGTGVLTATPTGTMPAGGVSAATLAVTFVGGGAGPSPTPTPTPTATPTLTPTPTVTPTATPTATPTPSPTSTPSPTTTPDPDLDGDEELADSITAGLVAPGKWRVEVTTAEPGTSFRIVGNRVGSKTRISWNALTTNQDGEFAFRTSRDLRGYRLRLVVSGVTIASYSVPAR